MVGRARSGPGILRFFLVALLAAGNPAAAIDFTRFTQPQHGYSLLLPRDWPMEANPSDADVRQVSETAGCFIQVSSAALARPVASVDFLRAFEAETLGPDKYYRRRLSEGPRRLAGREGWEATYDISYANEAWRGRLALLTAESRVYLILLACRKDAFDRSAGLLDAIADSFSLPHAAVAQPPSLPDGYLGLALRALSEQEAAGLGLSNKGGVLVGKVHEATPAAAAGFRPGDLIVQIGNRPAASLADVTAAPAPLGHPLDVAVLRRGELRMIRVVPGPRPSPEPPQVELAVIPAVGIVMEQASAWARSDVSESTTSFTKPLAEGTAPAEIAIERVPPGWSNERAVREATIESKRRIRQSHKDAQVFDGPAYAAPPADAALPGAQYEAEYRIGQRQVRRWCVVLSDGYGGAVVWSYAADENAFDAHLGDAKAMLRSLIIFARPVAR